MTDALVRLRNLTEAATPAPWHKEMLSLGPNGGGPMTLGVGSEASPVCIVHGIVESPRGQRDATFIAAMRNALPLLLDLVEKADEVRRHGSLLNYNHYDTARAALAKLEIP